MFKTNIRTDLKPNFHFERKDKPILYQQKSDSSKISEYYKEFETTTIIQHIIFLKISNETKDVVIETDLTLDADLTPSSFVQFYGL